MPIKAIYDSEADVPEEFKALFTEKNGKWELTEVEGMRTTADVERVQDALRKEKNDHKETKAKLGRWAGLEFDDVRQKLDRFDELEAAAADKLDEKKINGIVEARLKGRLAPVERERDEIKAKLDQTTQEVSALRSERSRNIIRSELRRAAVSAKVVDTAIDDILDLGERVFQIEEDGSVRVKDSVGFTPGVNPEVWLKDMEPKRPHWWPASQGGGARGSNGAGGSGPNPWTSKGWNVTEQSRIYKEKGAEHAEMLAKQAGTRVGGPRPEAAK